MSDIIKTQRSLARKATHDATHRFDHLYRVICQEEWIRDALEAILANTGAATAGIDHMTKNSLKSERSREMLTQLLRESLRTGEFRPTAVRRVYIPKSDGKMRPLGIPIIKDRIVQMLLKMVLEPIWESDFLNCSNGFRPGRRTMDCLALLDSYINNRSKYFWVIEGDIKGAFDAIHHEILLNLLSVRIADGRIIDLIRSFLKAGIMEGGLIQRSDLGTPQGGVCSPLLANIYLHQLDLFWWNKYGSLSPHEKAKRRETHAGNCALIRYADDWLLLTNGGKEEAHRLRDEIQAFLRDELKLELSVEKTHVTHVNDGFDFLGFHVRRYVSGDNRPKMLITPSDKAQERLKAKIKEMTDGKAVKDIPRYKIQAMNAVLRGWICYYRHCNASETAKDLDFWVNRRLLLWLQKRHRIPMNRLLAMYKLRQDGRRYNLGATDEKGTLFLYRMSDQPIIKYRSRKPPNPYLDGEWKTEIAQDALPIEGYIWLGNTPSITACAQMEPLVSTDGKPCEG